MELQSGKIEIDGRDISRMGLRTLRDRLALVPQDTTLFLGTLRENLYAIPRLCTWDSKPNLVVILWAFALMLK